jgi:hypothetical protein
MQATCHWPFFKGTISMPTVKDPSKISEAKKKEIEAWEHNNLAACYLLSQHLPDSVTVRLQAYNTAKQRWDHCKHDENLAPKRVRRKDVDHRAWIRGSKPSQRGRVGVERGRRKNDGVR